MPIAPELASLVNALPTPYMLLSSAFVIEAASDAYLRATLTSREQLVGQYLFDAFPDNPRTPEAQSVHNLHDSLQQVLATGQPHEMAQQHYDVPDPEHPGQFVERHWQPLNSPVLDAQGRVVQIIHSARDVTAEVQDQQHLRTSQVAEQAARAAAEQQRYRFHEVLMQLPAYVAVYHGPDHIYQFVNPPYQALFPHRSFAGRPFREGTPEANALGVVALFDQVYQTGEPCYVRELEGWFDFHGTGELEQVFLNLSLHPLRNAQGGIDGILDFSYDITAQVRARAAAEAERQRLYQVLMCMPANIALLRGPAHIYDLVNPEYERLFPARIPLGHSLREVIPELEGQGFYELFDRVYETGEPFYEAETQAWADFAGTGSLQCRYYRTAFEPIRNAQGEVTEVLNFAVDVTAQVEARHQIEQLNQEAQATRAEVERERALLQALLTQAPMSVGLYTGDDLHVVAASALFADLVGSTVAHLVGRPLLEGLPELRGQGLDDLLRQVMATQVPFIGTEMPATTRRAGELHTGYYNSVYQPLYAADRQVIGVMSVAVDVTEQVRARQQMEQLNAELETRVQERTHQLAAAQEATERQRRQWYELFRQAPAGICISSGPEWVYEFINPGYQALFPGRALLDKRLLDALPELADQPIMAILRRIYDTGEPFEASEVLVRLARTEGGPVEDIYFDLTHQARRNEAGQVDGVVTYVYDVTEQVLARQEREAQQHRLYTIFEQAPVGISIQAGPDLVFEFHNPSYQHMVPDRRLLGRAFFNVFPEMAGTNVEKLLRHVCETGETQQAQDLLIPVARADGSAELEERYFNIVYQARRDEQGRINGVITFVMEVTEQVQARQQVQDLNEELAAINEELRATNEELQDSNDQLTRTNVDLDTFVYTASHDLKAPITNIESILLALRSALPMAVQQDELVARLLTLLGQTVTRFQFTIAQLTDLSKLQLVHAGPAEPVHLATAIEAVLLDLAPAIEAAEARLTVEVAPEVVVSFSPANLRSIVYNLLSNAVKYRALDRPAQVVVRALRVGPRVKLAVQDNGLGLNAHQQQRLFGLFQRLHTHVEGTGVGLYITKRLVENGGGTIVVHSQPNAGTTFTVTLPA